MVERTSGDAVRDFGLLAVCASATGTMVASAACVLAEPRDADRDTFALPNRLVDPGSGCRSVANIPSQGRDIFEPFLCVA